MVPEQLLQEAAHRFSLLGDVNRLRILSTLHEEGEQSTGALAEKAGLAVANVSQHLARLMAADPVSGMHCWHQAVRVRRAGSGEAPGDIGVDTERSRAVCRRWLELTRSAYAVSPDGTRRPYWLLRPLKPGQDAFRLPRLTRTPT